MGLSTGHNLQNRQNAVVHRVEIQQVGRSFCRSDNGPCTSLVSFLPYALARSSVEISNSYRRSCWTHGSTTASRMLLRYTSWLILMSWSMKTREVLPLTQISPHNIMTRDSGGVRLWPTCRQPLWTSFCRSDGCGPARSLNSSSSVNIMRSQFSGVCRWRSRIRLLLSVRSWSFWILYSWSFRSSLAIWRTKRSLIPVWWATFLIETLGFVWRRVWNHPYNTNLKSRLKLLLSSYFLLNCNRVSFTESPPNHQ